MNRRAYSRLRRLAGMLLPALALVTAFVSTFLGNCSAAAQSQDTENEIVANLAGGRVIVHVTKDNVIVFGAIDNPVEAGSVPPRVADLELRAGWQRQQ